MNDYQVRLGNALATVLDAIEKHGAQHQDNHEIPEKFRGAMSLPDFDEYISTGHYFMVDPIGQALRRGVREIGKIMARNGFTSDQAEQVAEYAAERSKNNSNYWSHICDKHFDGVEFADGEWVA